MLDNRYPRVHQSWAVVTIREAAERAGVSLSEMQRRRARGQSVEQATGVRPKQESTTVKRRQDGTWFFDGADQDLISQMAEAGETSWLCVWLGKLPPDRTALRQELGQAIDRAREVSRRRFTPASGYPAGGAR